MLENLFKKPTPDLEVYNTYNKQISREAEMPRLGNTYNTNQLDVDIFGNPVFKSTSTTKAKDIGGFIRMPGRETISSARGVIPGSAVDAVGNAMPAVGKGLLATGGLVGAKALYDNKMQQANTFSYMQENTANFMVDPSMLIDVANNVVGSGGHMLADAGGFLQQHANPIIMGISGILGTKARGNAAVKTAEAGAKIAEDINKAKVAGQAAGQRAGLLKGLGLGVTGGIAGGALLNHGLNKNDY